MTDNDLVSRLRAIQPNTLVGALLPYEAADEIEAMKHDIDRLQAIVTELATENARLRSALEMIARPGDFTLPAEIAREALAGSPGETRGELCPDCDGWMHAHGLGCKRSAQETTEKPRGTATAGTAAAYDPASSTNSAVNRLRAALERIAHGGVTDCMIAQDIAANAIAGTAEKP